MAEVTLYDLPSRDGKAWSLNPWKTRAALHFKGIPYKTQWVEYPDVKPLLSSFGIPPHDPSKQLPEYTIPAVRLPGDHYVMDSDRIAITLEALQPEPSLRLDSKNLPRTQQAVQKTMGPLAPEVMPKIPLNLLNEPSARYFEETRGKRFGMPLAEFAKCDKAGEAAWRGAEEGLKALRELLTENKAGPFVEGDVPTYADIVLAGFLEFLNRADQSVCDRVLAYDESIKAHREATKKWLERQDH